nr:MAG TPA: hypothetical protein [Caudoviricetes sp.]
MRDLEAGSGREPLPASPASPASPRNDEKAPLPPLGERGASP